MDSEKKLMGATSNAHDFCGVSSGCVRVCNEGIEKSSLFFWRCA